MKDPRITFGRLGNQMFQYARIVAEAKKGNIPDWFVQGEEYFEGAEENVKKLYSDGIGYLPYVGVHLRVGGNPINPNEPRYMENPFYTNLCNTGYYIKALEHFPKNEGWKYIVFSDDMDYARAYFEGYDFGFDDSEDDISSFNRFASCHHKILANSSFSWWAGYLSNMEDAKIISCREDEWYSDKIIRTKLPEKWIKIKL